MKHVGKITQCASCEREKKLKWINKGCLAEYRAHKWKAKSTVTWTIKVYFLHVTGKIMEFLLSLLSHQGMKLERTTGDSFVCEHKVDVNCSYFKLVLKSLFYRYFWQIFCKSVVCTKVSYAPGTWLVNYSRLINSRNRDLCVSYISAQIIV